MTEPVVPGEALQELEDLIVAWVPPRRVNPVGRADNPQAILLAKVKQLRAAVARPALPVPPDPAKFSERPFAEAVARVALLAMERTGMDLIGKYSREPVYPEAFVSAVADMWVRGRPKGGAALPAPEPPTQDENQISLRCGETWPDEERERIVNDLRVEQGHPEGLNGGCGKGPVKWMYLYRCVECGRFFHRTCIGKHFALHGAALPAGHAPPDPSREAIQAARDCLVTFYFDQPGNQLEAWAGHPHDDELVDALKAAYAVDCGSRPALAGRGDTMSPNEARLRRLLWLRHGCSIGALYGDDGELSCGNCLIDFKRWDAETIENTFNRAGRVSGDQETTP